MKLSQHSELCIGKISKWTGKTQGIFKKDLSWDPVKHMMKGIPISNGIIPRNISPIFQSKHFQDFKYVKVMGGKGGDGAMSFLSLPFKEFAGPDGGNGGNGGHVIFEGNVCEIWCVVTPS